MQHSSESGFKLHAVTFSVSKSSDMMLRVVLWASTESSLVRDLAKSVSAIEYYRSPILSQSALDAGRRESMPVSLWEHRHLVSLNL